MLRTKTGSKGHPLVKKQGFFFEFHHLPITFGVPEKQKPLKRPLNYIDIGSVE